MKRRISRKVNIGGIEVGGNAPIGVQSMLNTKTTDVEACVNQIDRLRSAGCDLVRLAVPDEKSAEAFGKISEICGLPLIADVHYSYKLAHLALDNGAKKIRMNPGNMTNYSEIRDLARRMSDAGVPVRVGVNGGSLHPKYKGMPECDALVESALECAEVFESAGLREIVIAIKASDTMTMIEANRKLAAICDYPIHLGVTEAGTIKSGLIKSSIGIGTLLQEGIGDTVRVSLTADPCEEVFAARKILKTLGLKDNCVEVISCPTCARTEIDVEALADEIEALTAGIDRNLRISVLGCPLNGIGEGENSDLGIAGGKEKSVILKDGKIYKTVDSRDLKAEFMKVLKEVLQ